MISLKPGLPRAYYYLGDLWYDKRQYDKAQNAWEKSAEIDGTFPTVFRNLSLVYYNKVHDSQKSKEMLEKAFLMNQSDARVFLELDQLYKKLGYSVEKRIKLYDQFQDTYKKRDDLVIEYITMTNSVGDYEKAYQMLLGRKFHPWEGGDRKSVV